MVSRRTVLLTASGVLAGALTGCGADEPGGGESGDGSASSRAPSSPAPARTPTAEASSPAASEPPSPTGAPAPKVDTAIVDGLDVPWGIAFLGSGDALVSERNSGRILRVTPAGKTSTIGEVPGVAAPSGIGEGGLLGIALAPDDETTLYVFHTANSDNRIVRFDLADGKLGDGTPVLSGIESSTHHHGGRLLFDRDGMLFVATGDGERSDLAQDRDALNGKILRVRPDGAAAPGNPYDNRTWSYGHRNIEGLAFDADGRLWATEFGDKKADELNLITRGGNYGWPTVEGRSDNEDFVSPKSVWSPTSSCSPAGLAITRSTAFVGALQGQCLFTVPLDGTDAGEPVAHFAETYGRIRSVDVAPDGALWVTTSNTDGRVDPGTDDDKILRVTL